MQTNTHWSGISWFESFYSTTMSSSLLINLRMSPHKQTVHSLQRIASVLISPLYSWSGNCSPMLCSSGRQYSHVSCKELKLNRHFLKPFVQHDLMKFCSFTMHRSRSRPTISTQIRHKSDNGNNFEKTEKGNSMNDSNVDTLLESWFYEVCQYGSLTTNIPFNTVVKPLNPQDYPNMNKVIVQLHYDVPNDSDSEIPSSLELSKISGLYSLNVTFDEDKANMNLNCDLVRGLDLPVKCTIYVPLKLGLMLKMNGDKDVYVEKMESDNIVIETESGDCELHSIKSGSTSVVSKTGNIISDSTLLGNTVLYTGGSGGIYMKKVQGSSVTCKTEMGPLSLKSLYTDSASFKTVNGSMNLGHCHGQMHVLAENSHLNIDSLYGDLDVALQNGSVNVLLSRHNRVDIDISTGDIGLGFPEGVSTDLNLSCPALSVDEKLDAHFEETDMPHHKEGFIRERGISQVNARTMSGTISLHLLDWIQTTKLAFRKEE